MTPAKLANDVVAIVVQVAHFYRMVAALNVIFNRCKTVLLFFNRSYFKILNIINHLLLQFWFLNYHKPVDLMFKLHLNQPTNLAVVFGRFLFVIVWSQDFFRIDLVARMRFIVTSVWWFVKKTSELCLLFMLITRFNLTLARCKNKVRTRLMIAFDNLFQCDIKFS